MQRITISIDDDLLELVDALKVQRGYESRSEVFRDIVRDVGRRERAEAPEAICIAVLSYVFDYETRDLAQRLARLQLDHHDIFGASLRVPLDHASSLEIAALRGRAEDVRHVSDEIATQRGVRHANLQIVPVTLSFEHHHHDTGVTHRHLEA